MEREKERRVIGFVVDSNRIQMKDNAMQKVQASIVIR